MARRFLLAGFVAARYAAADDGYPAYANWGTKTTYCSGSDSPVGGDFIDAAGCWEACHDAYPETVAIDYTSGGGCYCQDACPCLAPHTPSGLTAVVLALESVAEPDECDASGDESSGDDIPSYADWGTKTAYCLGREFEIAPIDDAAGCWEWCQDHGADKVAVRFTSEGECWCTEGGTCPCLVPHDDQVTSVIWALESVVEPERECTAEEIKFGGYPVYAEWGTKTTYCAGSDSQISTGGGITDAAGCWAGCHELRPETVAIDYTSEGECYCQDACPCFAPHDAQVTGEILALKHIAEPDECDACSGLAKKRCKKTAGCAYKKNTCISCSGLSKKKCKKTNGCAYKKKQCSAASSCSGLSKRECKTTDGCKYKKKKDKCLAK